MRLTHIKLSGFKSFVDPTTIAVPAQLVAVVGPNGCGKSNVIDAVRWVLGEASAKQLRGESMQDVIFNGAATRKAAPRAAVELVFNNDSGTLQGAWGQYTDIAIKRQLTRQGDSSYYINGQPVRRRDITDLFLGTGVGARGYAVIEQGMISRIIEARPEELRAYIEEAAGVSKYKERRRETENRLKDTREHLQRLADIQSELKRQVEKLQRQAHTAEHYRSLQAELAHSQNMLHYVQWQQALADADAATAEHLSHQARQDELSEEAQALTQAIYALQQTEQAQQQTAHQHNNQRALLREQWARLEEQIRHRQSLQQRFERDKNQAQIELQKLYQQKTELNEQAQALHEAQEAHSLTLEEWAMAVAEHELQLPELEQQVQQAQQAQHNQQHELSRLERELAIKQQQQNHAKHALQQLNERQQRLTQEMHALALPEDEAVISAQRAAEQAQIGVTELEHRLHECEQQLYDGQQQQQHAQNQHRQLSQQSFSIEAQHQALLALMPGNDNDAADFWQQVDAAKAPKLWQQIRVDENWRHAVAVALGTRIHACAVADDFAPPSPLPEATAAWLYVSAAAQPCAQDSIVHHIHSQAPYEAALTYWLGCVRCAPSLAAALQQRRQLSAHECWITPEGHKVDAAGVVVYALQTQDNLLQRQAQIDALAQRQHALQQPLAESHASLQRAEEACHHAHEERSQQQQALKEAQQQLQAALSQAAKLLAQTNQGQLRREHIQQELAHIAQQQAQQSQIAQQSSQDAHQLAEALAALQSQQQHRQYDNHTCQQTLKQAQLALLEAKRQHGLADMALHKLQQQQQHLAQQQQANEQQCQIWQERQSELALAYETDADDEEQQHTLDALNAQMEAANDAYIAAQAQLSDTQKQHEQQHKRQQQLTQALPQVQAATQQALLRQQEALLHAKRFYEHLQQNQADIDALAKPAQQHTDLGALADTISRLNARIQALGAVNLAALDELNEADERSRYYAAQSADVEAAMALLQQAIAQIDEETKARFKHTFDAVNQKVQMFFPTLFGGGEACLHMVGDDLLSAGVSIMARPPGKKNSTIHLLSGGEKALTAMSLVFALFSLNPAPFCLLDEVDAPLDDANTSRFCNLVREMSAQTQFLYISHNRLTMEMAEQLVGVTMQEKGVSRIVAVDIKQALSLAQST